MPEAICNHLIEAKPSFKLFILHDYIHTIFIGDTLSLKLLLPHILQWWLKAFKWKRKTKRKMIDINALRMIQCEKFCAQSIFCVVFFFRKQERANVSIDSIRIISFSLVYVQSIIKRIQNLIRTSLRRQQDNKIPKTVNNRMFSYLFAWFGRGKSLKAPRIRPNNKRLDGPKLAHFQERNLNLQEEKKKRANIDVTQLVG